MSGWGTIKILGLRPGKTSWDITPVGMNGNLFGRLFLIQKKSEHKNLQIAIFARFNHHSRLSSKLQIHKNFIYSSNHMYFQFNIFTYLLSSIIYSTLLCCTCLFILQSFFSYEFLKPWSVFFSVHLGSLQLPLVTMCFDSTTMMFFLLPKLSIATAIELSASTPKLLSGLFLVSPLICLSRYSYIYLSKIEVE